MIMSYIGFITWSLFYTANKSSANPLPNAILTYHYIISSRLKSCSPPNLSREAGNALIPLYFSVIIAPCDFNKRFSTVHAFFFFSLTSTIQGLYFYINCEFPIRSAALTLKGSTSLPSDRSISSTSAGTSSHLLNISQHSRYNL